MKNNYYFILLGFSILPLLPKAQMTVGIKSGVNFATIKGQYSDQIIKLGWYGGGTLNIPFSPTFSSHLELLFSSKGSSRSLTYNGPDYVPPKTKMRINYIDMPILFSYRIVEEIILLAGPEFGYMTSIKEKFSDVEIDRKRYHPEKIDFAIDVGAQYAFVERYAFEIRYSYGFKSIHYVTVDGTRLPEKAGNRVFQIGFNYLIY